MTDQKKPTQFNVCPYCFEKDRELDAERATHAETQNQNTILRKALIATEAVSQERRVERDKLLEQLAQAQIGS